MFHPHRYKYGKKNYHQTLKRTCDWFWWVEQQRKHETPLLSNLPPFFQDWLGRVHPPSLTLTWEAGCCRAWAGARAWAWVRRAGASRSQSGRPRGPKAPAWVSTDHPHLVSGSQPLQVVGGILYCSAWFSRKKNKKKIESNPGMWIRRKTEGWPSRVHDGEIFPYWENWGKPG